MVPFGGPLAGQMSSHILLMSAVAPLAVAAWHAFARESRLSGPGRSLAAATVAQLALLWGWHAPPALDLALREPAAHLIMSTSLLLAALWFWSAVLAARGPHRWRALLALLVTGKVSCLLGVLLVFAPRTLYASSDSLSDQQLAGLLMLIACPLTYVAVGVAIAAKWIGELDTGSAKSTRPRSAARSAAE